ncbi:cupin domain-containing protein [Engelhardtia mirabilis]|uniref:Cupin domain protein n=1 Tax=Engelhardtia mirabilis TaxID=2528011 RepID=A0A518BFX5_9BACT|nr:Cupin domain protein [Planctomycetes bacterium Pla133]QDV00198.1 Cupin domain protein [Planctomycetes bacterium Pla86]
MNVKNLRREAQQLRELWSPKVVGRVNDQYVKVAKVQGELAWHAHEHEDELFLVLAGELVIEYEDRRVVLGEGDFHVVPKGVRHNPVCERECLLALIETVTTKHTGELEIAATRSIAEQLGAEGDL